MTKRDKAIEFGFEPVFVLVFNKGGQPVVAKKWEEMEAFRTASKLSLQGNEYNNKRWRLYTASGEMIGRIYQVTPL